MNIPTQYDSLSPAEVAKILGVTAESVKQARRRAAGLCRYCDMPALERLTLCQIHRTQKSATDRTRKGSSPWKPGGRGRPPVRVK